MAVIIDGTTGVATPGVTDTGNLSVAGSTTLTTPLPVASGGTGASSLSGIAVGNLTGGSAGTIPYQSTVGTTAMLATGTSGQALISAGPSAAPAWGTPSAATNLAGGSAGTIPYQTASGTTAMLAAGTSGQALISNGTSAPSWGSAGALTYIGTYTASSQATLDITFTGSYSAYQIILNNFVPATAGGVNAYLRTTTDSFSTVVDWGGGTAAYGFTSGTNYGNADQHTIGYAIGSTTAASGSIIVYDPLNSGTFTTYTGHFTGFNALAGGWWVGTIGGSYTSRATTQGVRFSFSSGNISTGTFRLYGIT